MAAGLGVVDARSGAVILVPIRTGRGQNDRGHWRTKHRSTKNQGTAVAWVLTRATKPAVPCSVLLTRVAPSNGLDSDNLVGSMKAIRDAIASWLGIDDKHAHLVRYRYDQRRGPWGVEIRFEPMAGTPPAGVCDLAQVGKSLELAA